MVSIACYVDEMEPVLRDQCKGQGKPVLFLLYGLNTDSGNFSKPAEFKVCTIYSLYRTKVLTLSLPGVNSWLSIL